MAKKTKEKKAATRNTPLQIVKEQFGEKSALVSKLAGKLDRKDGESKGDFEKRLSKTPSKKLLVLNGRIEEVEKLGGRSTMIDAIHDFHAKSTAKTDSFKEDAGYKKHLDKKTTGDLYDRYQTIQKKLRQSAK